MNSNIVICNRIPYDKEDFIALCIDKGSTQKVAEVLGCSRSSVQRAVKKYFPELRPGSKLSVGFLELSNKKKCSCCKEIKDLTSYYKTKDLYQSQCKDCQNKQRSDSYHSNIEQEREKRRDYINSHKEVSRRSSAKRRASKLNRTPKWADLEKIKEIYDKCPKGYEVDHIIPLQGKTVSGLHIAENLQYLTPEDNRQKSNKYKDE